MATETLFDEINSSGLTEFAVSAAFSGYSIITVLNDFCFAFKKHETKKKLWVTFFPPSCPFPIIDPSDSTAVQFPVLLHSS